MLFYEDNKSPQVKKWITTLEKFDLSDLGDVPFVRCSDAEEAEEFGIAQQELPKIVLFDNSVPDEYSGDILDLKSKFFPKSFTTVGAFQRYQFYFSWRFLVILVYFSWRFLVYSLI